MCYGIAKVYTCNLYRIQTLSANFFKCEDIHVGMIKKFLDVNLSIHSLKEPMLHIFTQIDNYKDREIKISFLFPFIIGTC